MGKLSQLKHSIFSNVYAVKKNILLESAIVSFSFDDVPRSGAVIGAEILESHGLRGTFYISMGMSTPMEQVSVAADPYKDGEKLLFANEQDVLNLDTKGHEIGCHSFSHLYQKSRSVSSIVEDCKLNVDLLSSLINKPIVSYSYPYGDINLGAKKLLRHQYSSLRTVWPGVNVGITDLSCLRSTSISGQNFNKDKMRLLVKSAVDKKAWLIFFTHEVCVAPNAWGTKIDEFDWLVDEVVKAGCKVEPVGSVCEMILGCKFNVRCD